LKCFQNISGGKGLSKLDQCFQCIHNVITGFHRPLPPVSSWSVCRISSSRTTIGPASSSTLWRCLRKTNVKMSQFDSLRTRTMISVGETSQQLTKSQSLSSVMGPSRMVAETLSFAVGMVLSAESVMALQCMNTCSIPSSSYTVKMGIIITFKFRLQMKTDSRQRIISPIVFSTGGTSFLCSSEAAISSNGTWSTCGWPPIRTISTTKFITTRVTYGHHCTQVLLMRSIAT